MSPRIRPPRRLLALGLEEGEKPHSRTDEGQLWEELSLKSHCDANGWLGTSSCTGHHGGDTGVKASVASFNVLGP